jgi:hypothetical protein
MQQTPLRASTTRSPGMARRSHAVLALAGSAALALGAPACGGGTAGPAPAKSATHGNIRVGGTGSGGSGRSGGSGPRGTGTFSRAFARCMRAHGVPDFPDPNGQSGQLGPSSGIDPNSPQFQAALNGPCESLAPRAWAGSGTVSR